MMFNKKVRPIEDVKLDEEILALEENLRTLSVSDDDYETTVIMLDKLYDIRQKRDESLEKCKQSRRTKSETVTKIITSVGMLGLTAAGLFLSYRIDNSDEILQNKQTLGFFNKIFKI